MHDAVNQGFDYVTDEYVHDEEVFKNNNEIQVESKMIEESKQMKVIEQNQPIINSDNEEEDKTNNDDKQSAKSHKEIKKRGRKPKTNRNKSKKSKSRGRKKSKNSKNSKSNKVESNNSPSQAPAMGVMTRRMKAELAKMDQKTN